MENYTVAFTLVSSKVKNMVSMHTEIKKKKIVNGGMEKFDLVWQGYYHLGVGHIKRFYKDNYSHQQMVNKILNGNLELVKMVKKPTIEDVFCSLLMDSNCDMSFRDWCEEFGYNHDSIKDKKVYDQCCEIRHQLVQSIGRNEMERLSDLLKDH